MWGWFEENFFSKKNEEDFSATIFSENTKSAL
jgi:hypothetical protein